MVSLKEHVFIVLHTFKLFLFLKQINVLIISMITSDWNTIMWTPTTWFRIDEQTTTFLWTAFGNI